jgi:hypothetical protein
MLFTIFFGGIGSGLFPEILEQFLVAIYEV